MRAQASLTAFFALVTVMLSPPSSVAAPTQLLATLEVTADSVPKDTGSVTLTPGATYQLVLSGSISTTFPFLDGSRTVVQDALFCWDHGGTPIPPNDPNPEACQPDAPGPALTRPLVISYSGLQDGPLLSAGYTDQHRYVFTFIYRPGGPAASLRAQWLPGTVTSHGGSIKIELYGEPAAGPSPTPAPTGQQLGCSLPAQKQLARAAQTTSCKSPEDVKRWNRASLAWNEMAADLCIVASVAAGSALVPGNQLPGGITSAAFGLGCALAWKASARYAKWANDPPDRNYKTVAKPSRFVVPKLGGATRNSRRASAALRALLQNFSDQASMTTALTHAFERTQGAAQAGDDRWEGEQREAAALYAESLSTLIRRRPRLAASARTALSAAGGQKLSVSRSGTRRAQRRVGTRGLPGGLSRTLKSAGLTAAERSELRGDLLLHTPSARGTSLLGALTDPDLAASDRAAAAAFARLAAALDKP